MWAGVAGFMAALVLLVPVGIKGYLDVREDMRKSQRERWALKQDMDAGFKTAKEGQAETKHLVNSHLDNIMRELRKVTGERDVLADEKKERLRREGD